MRIRYSRHKCISGECGAAFIEFAVILPLLIVVLIGVYDIARYISWEKTVNNMLYDMSNIISRQQVIEGIDPETGIYMSGNARLQKMTDSIIEPRTKIMSESVERDIIIANYLFPKNIDLAADDTGVRQMWIFKSANNSSAGNFPHSVATRNVNSKIANIAIGNNDIEIRPGEGINVAYFRARFKPALIPDLGFFTVEKMFWVSNDLDVDNYICTDCSLSSAELSDSGRSLRAGCPDRTKNPLTSGCVY